MPNFGLELDLPETWVHATELQGDDPRNVMWADVTVARLVGDPWQATRLRPGWDVGVLAAEPSGTVIFAELLDSSMQARGLDGNVTEIGPPSAEVTTIDVLGREARRAEATAPSATGLERQQVAILASLETGELFRVVIAGSPEAFDLATADRILSSIRATGIAPAGRPWSGKDDPALEAVLAPLGSDQLLSGDLLAIVMFGGAEGNDLLSVSTAVVPGLIDDPSLIGVALSGPSDRASSEPSVTVMRWTEGAIPDWGGIESALVEHFDYEEAEVGSCPAVRAPAQSDGTEAVFVATDDLGFWIYGTAESRLIAALQNLAGC